MIAPVRRPSSRSRSSPSRASPLTVFQRTANYMVPAHNKPLDPAMSATSKANYEVMRRPRQEKCRAGIDFAFNPRLRGSRTDEAEPPAPLRGALELPAAWASWVRSPTCC